MENPWSSPWTTDDDPARDATSGPAGDAALAFPAAVKFDIADPSSLWAHDDGFGAWEGGSGELKEDVGESEVHDAKEVDNGGFVASPGPDADSSPSPSAEEDPWAAVVSPIDEAAPEEPAYAEKPASEQSPPEDPGFASTFHADPAPLISTEPRASPPHARSAGVDHRARATTPEPAGPDDDDDDGPPLSPEVGTPGKSAEAVAQLVLKHGDAASSGLEETRPVGKVQELVDMYDGIAKKASTPPPAEQIPPKKPEGTTSSPAPSDAAADEDAEDWEDFEFGEQQSANDAPSTQPAPLPTSTSPEPSPDATAVDFPIDEALITTLFDSLAEEPPAPTTPADIPEHLEPLAAFTVAERKAWYRLSRQGSARLHDCGDPDNYTRATWSGSATSAATFAIVRRWMQEGSAPGSRARAGGGARGGSAATFGWEATSSSDPVDLSFLRRRRSAGGAGGGRQRSESAAVAAAPGVVVAGGDRGGAGRPFSVPAPPKGFNLAAAPLAAAAQNPRTTKPSPLVLATSQDEAPSSLSRESDEDEEWGEMVSSPQVAGFGAVAAGARADSAVSFGKTGSGSSLDSRRATQFEDLPVAKSAEVEEVRTKLGGNVGGPSPLGADRAAKAAVPTIAAEDTVQIQGEEKEAVREIISGLPDLSYMLQ